MTARAPAVGEDRQALARFIFGLTLGVGAMAAAAGGLTGQPSVVVAAPSAVLAATLWAWHGDGLPHPAAGWAGAAVWLVLVTLTHDDTALVPLAMAAICTTFAIGPDRVAAWVSAQWMRDDETSSDSAAEAEPAADDQPGWIEEDGHRV